VKQWRWAKWHAEVEKMTNEVGPSAREDSAYGFSANERAHIVRGMCDEEQAPMAVNALAEAVDENHHLAPRSQLDFVNWAQHNHDRVFRVKQYPTGLKIIKAPRVKGLRVFAAEGYGGQLYAAWAEHDGQFMGWLWYWPSLSRIDHDFAIGEVLGRPVFGDMDQNCVRRGAVRTWRLALQEAARAREVS
jgi:hypothetical protein